MAKGIETAWRLVPYGVGDEPMTPAGKVRVHQKLKEFYAIGKRGCKAPLPGGGETEK